MFVASWPVVLLCCYECTTPPLAPNAHLCVAVGCMIGVCVERRLIVVLGFAQGLTQVPAAPRSTTSSRCSDWVFVYFRLLFFVRRRVGEHLPHFLLWCGNSLVLLYCT